jgi:hypothetical protein
MADTALSGHSSAVGFIIVQAGANSSVADGTARHASVRHPPIELENYLDQNVQCV